MSLDQSEGVRNARTHRRARLITITRTDNTVFRFTDHPYKLVVSGNTYSPVGGGDMTAVQHLQGLQDSNVDFLGIVNSDDITEDDLVGGKFNEAEVQIQTVDWRVPWLADVDSNVYLIEEVTFEEGQWQAKLSGKTIRLKQKVGHNVTRDCQWAVYDDRCTVVRTSFETSGTVGTVENDRLEFHANTTLSPADDYFNDGEIVWQTGDNAGLTSHIKDYVKDSGGFSKFTLHVPTRYPVSSSDTFKAYPGCDGTVNTCVTVYNNLENFGGFPFVPGTSVLLSTPEVK